MEMELIIASHTVKPSSPTPPPCKTHTLSSLDQIQPSLIFFYENQDSHDHAEMSSRLRQSLSEILTIFYPLAGQIKGNSFVDCDDGGVEFLEARVPASLHHFIQNPQVDQLKQFVPRDSLSHQDDIILCVKASFFDCGGVSVGVCLSHKIGDALSLSTFVTGWAAACRGETSGIIRPSFDLALYFPPADDPSRRFGNLNDKIMTKRLVFDREKVEELRRLSTSDEVKNPSKVEAVSAFIWRSFIDANNRAKQPPPFVATHIVNLRPRTVPPMADHVFGNCFTTISAIALSSEGKGDDYVCKFRAAIRAVDDEYINKVVKDDNYYYCRPVEELFTAGNCVFTSWRRFPVYEIDFGWGKPAWVGTVPMPLMNAVFLLDTHPSQDGVEARVNLPHNHPMEFQY